MRGNVRALSAGAAALAMLLALLACAPVDGNAISGEVRFVRDVELPEGATLEVSVVDVSLADAPSTELGRQVIEDPGRLPARFRVTYDSAQIESRNRYALQARIRLGEELLYINDTVHPVLTQGAPRQSDILVISVDPFDRCIEPLAGILHVAGIETNLPEESELRVRLLDVSDPDRPAIVTERSYRGLAAAPIDFELPHEGVAISRHKRYELEAEVWAGDELRFHIPTAEWRKTVLAHCPNREHPMVNELFEVGALE